MTATDLLFWAFPVYISVLLFYPVSIHSVSLADQPRRTLTVRLYSSVYSICLVRTRFITCGRSVGYRWIAWAFFAASVMFLSSKYCWYYECLIALLLEAYVLLMKVHGEDIFKLFSDSIFHIFVVAYHGGLWQRLKKSQFL